MLNTFVAANTLDTNINTTDGIINLGIKRSKENNAAYHLVPFLIKVLDIEETDLTKAIAKSIVELDELAQKIDLLIENKNWINSSELSYIKFENLETKIVDCFSYLKNSPQSRKLILDTLECVDVSFKYNTYERHRLYNLQDTTFNGCTTFYLLPLYKYLFSLSKFQDKDERLFHLFTNYIQMLDDYTDMFDDRSLNINTPITVRLNEIEGNYKCKQSINFAFNQLSNEVNNCLHRNYDEIKNEAHSINGHLNSEIFDELEIFLEKFKTVSSTKETDEKLLNSYLKKVHKIVPPIICYSG